MGPRSPTTIVPWRLAALAGVCAVLAGCLYALTIGTSVGQLLGELILGGRPDQAAADSASVLLASVSRTTLIIGSVGLVGWALLQGRPRLALGVLVVIVGANLATQLAKTVLLDRADQLDGLFYPLSNSFPSGHATAAASLAVALLLVVPPVLRVPIAIPSSLLVALVGVATLTLGWHRMADAVGGTLVATSWAAGVGAVLVWRRGVETVGARSGHLGRVGSRVLIVAGLIMLVVGWLAYLLAALDPLGVLLVLADRGGSPALFAVGVVIVIGASFVALGALVYALRDVRLDPVRQDAYRHGPRAPGAGPQANDAGSAAGGAETTPAPLKSR
jgi:membrane-associated phospholipid phosphatase